MEDGQVAGMVVAFQDISERRRLERMKDEFISTVSHELRTPLTSLRASLGLIQSGALDKRPEKQRQMVEMAIGNCDRLIRLVNDILDFDGVEKRRLPLNRAPVEAIDLLRRAADVAHAAATQSRMEFRIDAKASPVFADSERVMQVLNELVTNAIKFSPPGTTIQLSARDTTGSGRGDSASGAKEVCFIVADQGRGIAPEKLERIFEPLSAGRCLRLARAGRDRPGPGALPQHRGAARRPHLGRKRNRQRKQVPVHAAGDIVCRSDEVSASDQGSEAIVGSCIMGPATRPSK